MYNVIYLVGAYRSGTNLLQWLLRENFKNTVVLAYHKHEEPKEYLNKILYGTKEEKKEVAVQRKLAEFLEETSIFKGGQKPPFAFVSRGIVPPKRDQRSQQVLDIVKNAIDKKEIKFLINIKNPYGWHLSYCKHWKHMKFPKEMKYWNDLYTAWAQFEKEHSEDTYFIKHENVLKDFKKELTLLQNRFDLVPDRKQFLMPDRRLSTSTDETPDRFKRMEYFKNELYVEDLTKNKQKELDECRGDLNPEIMKRFGYKIL